MKVAIYNRKALFTSKDERTENPIEMCKEHYLKTFPNNDCEFEIFEDEGYSGLNIKRPELQKLLSEIEKNKFDALICSSIERLSRNVVDIESILNLLKTHDVSFILSSMPQNIFVKPQNIFLKR